MHRFTLAAGWLLAGLLVACEKESPPSTAVANDDGVLLLNTDISRALAISYGALSMGSHSLRLEYVIVSSRGISHWRAPHDSGECAVSTVSEAAMPIHNSSRRSC